jgi:NADPH:quinone reductase
MPHSRRCVASAVVSCLGWGSHALVAATYPGAFTLLPLLAGEGRAQHSEIMAEATRLAEAGKLVPRIDPCRFTLASARDACGAIKDRTARGKIVHDLVDPDQRPDA